MHLMHLFRVAAVYRVQLVHLILAVGNFGLTTVFWISVGRFGHIARFILTKRFATARTFSFKASRQRFECSWLWQRHDCLNMPKEIDARSGGR